MRIATTFLGSVIRGRARSLSMLRPARASLVRASSAITCAVPGCPGMCSPSSSSARTAVSSALRYLSCVVCASTSCSSTGCLVERQLGPREQRFGQPLGLLEAAAQIHGLDVAHRELVAEPRVADVAREIEAGDEMAKGGLVGVGVLGLLAGAQVQSGELGLLLARGGPRHAARLRWLDDLEQPLLALLRRRLRHDQPADLVVQVRPFGWRDHGVGRLLQAVVDEAVGDGGVRCRFRPRRVFVALADRGDDFLGQRLGERGRRLARRPAGHDGERLQVELVADAGGEAQQALGRSAEPPDALGDQVGDVVGDLLLLDALDLPGPARRARIEGEQPLFLEHAQELTHEERIALRLRRHQVGERRRRVGRDAQGVGDQRPHAPPLEGRSEMRRQGAWSRARESSSACRGWPAWTSLSR